MVPNDALSFSSNVTPRPSSPTVVIGEHSVELAAAHNPLIDRHVTHAEVASPMTVVLADGDHNHNVDVASAIISTFKKVEGEVGNLVSKVIEDEKPFYDKALFKREDFPPDSHARFGDSE